MSKNFRDFAPTPPMGWNSWDCFGAGVTEQQLFENAEFMEAHLKTHGWKYIVCDIQWSEPTACGTTYHNFAPLYMDTFGRLFPAPNRFPSAQLPKNYCFGVERFNDGGDGCGFKQIGDCIHSLGLKFGIHIMRGIPRQAVALNLPIKGTNLFARDIVHPFSVCSWNTDMYGLKDCVGAQEYYDSIIELYSDWGVDFIKCDDIAITEFSKFDCPYSAAHEIEMLRKAIDKSGREIVLSLSPGPAPLNETEHLKANANMWRMTGDFWDRWDKLREMFDYCKSWDSVGQMGNYPDCDMLPLGVVSKNDFTEGERNRKCNFTIDEQITMLTLWGTFGSPLMIGGNLPEMTDEVLSLLINDEYIHMLQCGKNRKEISRNENGLIIRTLETDNEKYYAYFNVSDQYIKFAIQLTDPFDVWSQTRTNEKSLNLRSHACRLFKVKR